MKEILTRIFLVNWPRKVVALLSALIIWFLVNQSVTVTKTFSNISVHIINLPPHKTVLGLMPGQILNKKISLTLTGPKDAIEDLDSSHITATINIEGREESFIAKIDKKNLSLFSKDESLKNRISDVSSNDLFIKITNLVTEEIPVTITSPIGDPPSGFQFLDISPKHLKQKVSGAEEEISDLKKKGLTLTFDLHKISKEELETIKSMQGGFKSDETSFFIPASWKKIFIPFQNIEEPLNDPCAQYLRIDFLKQELLNFDIPLAITLFFPEKYSATLNPLTVHFKKNFLVEEKNGLFFLNLPLYVGGVSRHFLDIVKENITLAVVVNPHKELLWTLLFIDEKALEIQFIAALSKDREEGSMYSEEILKNRFHTYLKTLQMYTNQEVPLRLKFLLENNEIRIEANHKL